MCVLFFWNEGRIQRSDVCHGYVIACVKKSPGTCEAYAPSAAGDEGYAVLSGISHEILSGKRFRHNPLLSGFRA
jgi:hypothetical protein